jgi:hypothetical protein
MYLDSADVVRDVEIRPFGMVDAIRAFHSLRSARPARPGSMSIYRQPPNLNAEKMPLELWLSKGLEVGVAMTR